jgi:cell division transport system permease protein
MSRTKPTYIYAIISVALVLFMLGFFALIMLHGHKLVTHFKERVDLWLELNPETPESEVARLVRQIRSEPFVRAESVSFVTKEQAQAAMKEDLGEDGMLSDMPNLFRDVVRFNVRSSFMDNDSLMQWRETMKADSVVADLFFDAVNTANIGQNIQNLSFLTLVLAALLIFAAVTLIHNTIRLALYANRFVIKNQELVGASWGFISKPYIRRSIWNGLISAILAIGGLSALLFWMQENISGLNELQNANGVIGVFVLLILLGILISWISTAFVVRKFLKMRLDDLY